MHINPRNMLQEYHHKCTSTTSTAFYTFYCVLFLAIDALVWNMHTDIFPAVLCCCGQHLQLWTSAAPLCCCRCSICRRRCRQITPLYTVAPNQPYLTISQLLLNCRRFMNFTYSKSQHTMKFTPDNGKNMLIEPALWKLKHSSYLAKILWDVFIY